MPIAVHDRAADIPATDWSALALGNDPFAGRAFLTAAEDCGAAGPDYGWQARHLTLRDDDGQLFGLMPLYLRSHSFGDFSRDWSWPPAWQQAGRAYYPKLVSGIPYTPSPGPRLLVRDGAASRHSIASSLLSATLEATREWAASSWQCLFVDDEDRALLANAGLLLRRGVQFHWQNRSYRDFEDFLAGFNAEKRKKLKRERRAVRESGLRLEVRHGDDIDTALWTAIHRQYRDTFLRYGNHPAFPQTFFERVAAELGRQMVVFLAWDDATQELIASAICYRNETTLFGRHWGAGREVPGLHFELCYYQGIEYAIRHGLQRFEPGAQGEHKLARGFEPVPTWSAFWIADPDLRRAVAAFVAREDAAMLDYQADTAAHLPFKQRLNRAAP